MSRYFIGVDAGGTSTRAVLVMATGEVVRAGSAEGANAWSSGTRAAATVTAAMREALGEHDAATVAAGVIAVAGAISSVPARTAEVIDGWHSLGLPGSPRIVLDVAAAYAAATTHPRGLVLAAGTGAIAGLVDDGELVRRAGGRGWLVGDEGSAVWLGIEGVRAALLALDRRGPGSKLTDTLRAGLGVEAGDRAVVATGITDAVYSQPPAQLGRLAPLVLESAEAGDPVAQALAEGAVDHLVRTAAAAAGDERPEVVVLAGSLLTRAAIIGEPVRERLAERWAGVPMLSASSGEAGAAALAIGRHTGVPVSESVLTKLQGSLSE